LRPSPRLLTIRGEKRSQRDEKKEHYQFAERTYGSFERGDKRARGYRRCEGRRQVR
jgi:hypothetical protein